MGFEGQAVGTVVKSGSWILLPTLWISIFFLVCMIGYDVFSSQGVIATHSMTPLVTGTLFSIIGADHKIGSLIDNNVFKNQYVSIKQSFSGFFNWLFERAGFWIAIFNNLWWIYVFSFLLYSLINFIGGDALPVLNKILLTIIIFAVLQFAVGILMYDSSMQDKRCVGSVSECLSLEVSHSYPFEGVISLSKHLFNKDLFNNVHQLNKSKLIQAISGVPNES